MPQMGVVFGDPTLEYLLSQLIVVNQIFLAWGNRSKCRNKSYFNINTNLSCTTTVNTKCLCCQSSRFAQTSWLSYKCYKCVLKTYIYQWDSVSFAVEGNLYLKMSYIFKDFRLLMRIMITVDSYIGVSKGCTSEAGLPGYCADRELREWAYCPVTRSQARDTELTLHA